VVLVTLTRQGRRIARTTQLPWQARLAAELEDLQPRQQQALARSAERIAHLLE
jgi:DNA-binding MarR family transcriptional regulator